MATAHPVNNDVKLLIKRVLALYEGLSRGDAAACYRLIDPLVRATVSRDTYFGSIAALHKRHRQLLIDHVDVQMCRDERAALYKNRDFAIVEVQWKDSQDDNFTHKGPWVKDGKSWYTRCVGYAPLNELAESSRTSKIPR